MLIGGGLAAVAIAQYWEQLFPARLEWQTQYAGLKLGMNPQEVMYIKGYPHVVVGEESTDPAWKGFFKVIKTSELEKGKTVNDYKHWSYDQYKSNINVVFNEERTAVI